MSCVALQLESDGLKMCGVRVSKTEDNHDSNFLESLYPSAQLWSYMKSTERENLNRMTGDKYVACAPNSSPSNSSLALPRDSSRDWAASIMAGE